MKEEKQTSTDLDYSLERMNLKNLRKHILLPLKNKKTSLKNIVLNLRKKTIGIILNITRAKMLWKYLRSCWKNSVKYSSTALACSLPPLHDADIWPEARKSPLSDMLRVACHCLTPNCIRGYWDWLPSGAGQWAYDRATVETCHGASLLCHAFSYFRFIFAASFHHQNQTIC